MKNESDPRQKNPLAEVRSKEPVEEAANLLKALGEIEGERKALVIIVDDNHLKREGAERFLTEASTTGDIKYVLSLKTTGPSAISLYEEFRRQEPPEKPHQVVAMLDGKINPHDDSDMYGYGDEVAHKLIGLSKQNGWKAPLLVGMSSETYLNDSLSYVSPAHYVGSTKQQDKDLLNALASKLTPPQTPQQ